MNKIEKIIHGDSHTLIKEIESETVDLVIVDPFFDIKQNELKEIIKESYRVLKPNGQLYLFMSWHNVAETKIMVEKETKFNLLNWIIWSRMSPGTNKKTYKNGREDILWFIKNKKQYTFNKQFRKVTGKDVLPYKNEDGSPRGWYYDELTNERVRWAETSNVWCYTRPTWSSKELTDHGMQKPLMLSDRIILTSTNENDLVLDVFAGSGSFCLSAKRLNRQFIGFEFEHKWVELINNRLNSAFSL